MVATMSKIEGGSNGAMECGSYCVNLRLTSSSYLVNWLC